MAKRQKVKEAAPVEEVQSVESEDQDVAPEVKAPQGKNKHGYDPDELVTIQIPVHIKIKRTMYEPGQHKVPRHILDTIREMVDKKTRSDLSIFTGKNFLINRLAGGTLTIQEVKKLD